MQFEYSCVETGDAGIGKTTLTILFALDRQMAFLNPTHEDSYRKQIHEYFTTLEVLDVAGEMASVPDYYWDGSEAFILCFSLTNFNTFDTVRKLHESILIRKVGKKVPMIIVGTKSDDVHGFDVDMKQLDEFCAKNHLEFVKTSSKECFNVTLVFETLVRMFYRTIGDNIELWKDIQEVTHVSIEDLLTKTTKKKPKCNLM